MADNKDRIVFPDEVEAEKAAAEKAKAAGDGASNTVEQPEKDTPQVTMRNMIVVPDNCPPGYQLINGVCREVFD